MTRSQNLSSVDNSLNALGELRATLGQHASFAKQLSSLPTSKSSAVPYRDQSASKIQTFTDGNNRSLVISSEWPLTNSNNSSSHNKLNTNKKNSNFSCSPTQRRDALLAAVCPQPSSIGLNNSNTLKSKPNVANLLNLTNNNKNSVLKSNHTKSKTDPDMDPSPNASSRSVRDRLMEAVDRASSVIKNPYGEENDEISHGMTNSKIDSHRYDGNDVVNVKAEQHESAYDRSNTSELPTSSRTHMSNNELCSNKYDVDNDRLKFDCYYHQINKASGCSPTISFQPPSSYSTPATYQLDPKVLSTLPPSQIIDQIVKSVMGNNPTHHYNNIKTHSNFDLQMSVSPPHQSGIGTSLPMGSTKFDQVRPQILGKTESGVRELELRLEQLKETLKINKAENGSGDRQSVFLNVEQQQQHYSSPPRRLTNMWSSNSNLINERSDKVPRTSNMIHRHLESDPPPVQSKPSAVSTISQSQTAFRDVEQHMNSNAVDNVNKPSDGALRSLLSNATTRCTPILSQQSLVNEDQQQFTAQINNSSESHPKGVEVGIQSHEVEDKEIQTSPSLDVGNSNYINVPASSQKQSKSLEASVLSFELLPDFAFTSTVTHHHQEQQLQQQTGIDYIKQTNNDLHHQDNTKKSVLEKDLRNKDAVKSMNEDNDSHSITTNTEFNKTTMNGQVSELKLTHGEKMLRRLEECFHIKLSPCHSHHNQKNKYEDFLSEKEDKEEENIRNDDRMSFKKHKHVPKLSGHRRSISHQSHAVYIKQIRKKNKSRLHDSDTESDMEDFYATPVNRRASTPLLRGRGMPNLTTTLASHHFSNMKSTHANSHTNGSGVGVGAGCTILATTSNVPCALQHRPSIIESLEKDIAKDFLSSLRDIQMKTFAAAPFMKMDEDLEVLSHNVASVNALYHF